MEFGVQSQDLCALITKIGIIVHVPLTSSHCTKDPNEAQLLCVCMNKMESVIRAQHSKVIHNQLSSADQ